MHFSFSDFDEVKFGYLSDIIKIGKYHLSPGDFLIWIPIICIPIIYGVYLHKKRKDKYLNVENFRL